MKDYVQAVKACLRAFHREGPLQHEGPYYKLSLLTEQWTPAQHDYEDVLRVAGEVADGVHVHLMHSMHYIRNRLLPGLAEGAARAGRDPAKIDKIVPVIVAAGDTPEERMTPIKEAKTTIAFYGVTPNYTFQLDDLGYVGLRLAQRLPQERRQREEPSADHRRDPRPVRHRGAPRGSSSISYLASHWREVDPKILERWAKWRARCARQAKRRRPPSIPRCHPERSEGSHRRPACTLVGSP
jgi:alkanesulfonate monooxygenase SsuD/methylene tetrahydromethanopterin reductase-like flavin-dependent oxidoreductase (luciferase family)